MQSSIANDYDQRKRSGSFPDGRITTKKVKVYTGLGALGAALALAVFFFLSFKTVIVSGDSMTGPAIHNGTRFLISNAYWLVGGIRDKDIVVIRTGSGPNDYIIKRIYKMAGETVDFYNVPSNWSLAKGSYVVPDGYVYVLGDNRAVSEDSRAFGPVRMSKIIGKVVVRPGGG